MLRSFFCLLVLATLPPLAFAENETLFVPGVKFPNEASEGILPIVTSVLSARSAEKKGFTELLPYVFRAPNQDEAGSCLFMSLTGIAEWWSARLHPRASRAADGPLDLSERFLMNFAGSAGVQNDIKNWKTDSIYLFNKAGGALRNRDYRYTKGWFKKERSGRHVKADAQAPGAEYGTAYNWIDERAALPASVELKRLPTFRRTVLFADPASDQWNTGVMPANIVDKIKTALQKNKAPVQIIYNHFGYWHSTMIVGFSDETDNQNCRFVHDFLDYTRKNSSAKSQELYRKTQAAYERGGGCHPKGVFYVRDSIYADPDGPVYDYDPDASGDEAPYTKELVLLEYDWVLYMANHAMQILAD